MCIRDSFEVEHGSGSMGDRIVLRELEVSVRVGGEQIPQDGSKFAGGPGARFLRRLFGRLPVDLEISIALLVFLKDHLGGNDIDDIPTGLPRFAHIARGGFLDDVVWQSFQESGRDLAGFFNQSQTRIGGGPRWLRRGIRS